MTRVALLWHMHQPFYLDLVTGEHILPWARLHALSGRAQAALFSAEDIRDLQVWHKLVWIDAYYFDRDERVRALVAKGRNFTESDKQTLRLIELEILRRVIPEYREAAARDQVEL